MNDERFNEKLQNKKRYKMNT